MLLLIAPSVNNVITGEYQVTVQTSCCDQTRIGRLYRRLRNGCSLHQDGAGNVGDGDYGDGDGAGDNGDVND